MKAKLYLKVISVVLVLALILQSIPIVISAETGSETTEATSMVEADVPYVIGEDINLREQSVKYFRMSDGSFSAVSYASPVHYLDSDGEYKDIDNTLVPSQSGYVNTDNPFRVTLPKESDGEVSVESENKKITFKLLDSKKVKTKVKENKYKTEKEVQKEAKKAKNKKEKAKIINDDKYTLKKYSSGVTYEGVADDVDISYDIYGSSLKESIVLNKKNAKSSYTYAFTYTGFTAVLNEDNSVSFTNGETEYFKLAAPYMFDSANAYSSDIEVKLTSTETGIMYELIPNKDWLKDKERVYPVTIDPTVVPKLNALDIKDATAIFANYNSTMENWAINYPTGVDYDYLIAGEYPDSSVEVGYCIYAAIPEGIPDTARIINAYLRVGLYSVTGSINVNNMLFNAYKITSDWNTGNINEESILFSTPRTGGYAIPSFDQHAIDFRYMSNGEMAYHDFNITKAAQGWQNGENNYGIMFRMDVNSLSSHSLAAFFSSDYNVNGVTNRPLFVYNYRDTSGLEDYWSYHSASAGDAGTGYVNDFGGNLTFIHNDTSYINERYNISISHVYNANNSSVNSSYGNGWRLNIGEFGTEKIENTNYYYYIDSDGTKHYFYNDNGTYKDEDGLGYIYSSVSGDYPKKITTKNHETMLFDSAGKLRRITDSNSNSIDFIYGSYGLTAVKIGDQDIITLVYIQGKLSSVTNNKTSRTANYSYSTTGNLISITQNWDNTTADTYTYTYSGNLLTSATDSTGYRISYSYAATGAVSRVQSVTESVLDGETRVNGQAMTFSYQNGSKTVVTDCGLDGDISTTADNNQMTYLFDVFGQPVSVYDEEGKGASYKYSNVENRQHNLTLSSATYGYIPGGELIKESNFRYNGGFWYKNGNVEFSGNCAYLLKDDCIYQNLTLNKGTYRVSAVFDKMTEDGYGVIKATQQSGAYVVSTDDTSLGGGGNFGSYETYLTFNVEYDNCIITICFEGKEGTVAVNSITGFKEPYSSKPNYITEGDFSYQYADYELRCEWQTDLAVFGAQETEITNYKNYYSKAMAIYPSCAPIDECYNKVYCNPQVSGNAGEVLLLSGWAKATAINNDCCTFALKLKINHTDGTTVVKQLDFDNNITDWQFGCIPVPVEKNYYSVTVTIDYSNQQNTGYFDDIQLIKDDAASYVYDDGGNVISAKTAVANSKYTYDGNSRLTSAIDTTGRNFKYNYDDNHNLTGAVSDAATVVRYVYNSFGQAVSSETYANLQQSEPKNGETYYMFLRSTGLYMKYTDDELVHDKLYYTSGEKFTLQKKNDGYYSIGILNDEYADYISITGSNGSYSIGISQENESESTHFKFVRDKKGGYRIVSKIGTNLCIDNSTGTTSNATVLTVSTVDEDNDNQVWYLALAEKIEEEPILSENKVYAIRNFFSGKYIAHSADTADSDFTLTAGDYNSEKYTLVKCGETEYYYIKVSGTNLVLSYNSTDNKIVLAEYSQTDESQLFSLNLTDEDPVARKVNSFSISPKLYNTRYLLDFAGNFTVGQMAGHWRSYWFFEELLYSSSTAVYKENGNLLDYTLDNASGLKTRYEYDNIGRVTEISVGQKDTANDDENRITANTYDSRDRVKRVDSGNAYVSYIYNGKNQLSYIRVNAGYGTQNYAFTYDTFGNNTKIMVGNYTLAQYSYIGNTGLMSGMTYGNNDGIAYTYDNDYRLTKTVYTDKNTAGTVLGTKTVGYEYDIFGNVYKLTDGFSGNITTYNYDLLGRITRTNKTSGLSRTVNYDAFDRINGFTLSVLGKNVQSSVVYGEFGQVNSFTNTIGDRVDTISYTYDDFYRRTSRKLEAINKTSTYTYLKGNGAQDTVLVETLQNGKDTYKYTYDIYGNITSIAKNGVVIESYVYDSFNQLTQVTKGTDVYTYTYDERGNVLSVKKNGIEEKDYTYSDSNWKDRLTNYNDTDITYDEIGNPLNWRDSMTFSWEYGRRLKGVTKGTDNISYTYDADGLRTSKTVNGTKTDYYWLDGVLQGQKTGNEHIIFLYDENGTAYGMLVDNNGTQSYYYYLFNLQGDIVGIMDSTGNTVVEYTYDAWGQLLSVTGDTALGNKNPIRYRGYYYDNETGFYYCNNRHYDPTVQRFITSDVTDVLTASPTAHTDKTLYAYCDNNPVVRVDNDGQFWDTVFDVISLGASIVEVCVNPNDPWAWAGLVGDVVDLIPFVTGVGEVTKAVRISVKAAENSGDVIKAARHIYNTADASSGIRKMTGSYEIIYKSGMTYIGKGNFRRATISANRYVSRYGDEVQEILWKSAPNNKTAFIDEYLSMAKHGGPNNRLINNKFSYNKIWSPGRKYHYYKYGSYYF